MSTLAPESPASAADRGDTGSVEVRDARGRLVCRTTAAKASEAVAGGAGRLVAGGRMLRIDRDWMLRQIAAEDSFTTKRERLNHSHIMRHCNAYQLKPLASN